MRTPLTLAALALSLALPATVADAARPAKGGSYFNGDSANGARLETTRYSIQELELFCTEPGAESDPLRYEYRANRFALRRPLEVGSDGRFSFRGRATRYGAEGQWLGRWKVRLSGRFTSRSRVTIKRTLPGCGSATVVARLEG